VTIGGSPLKVTSSTVTGTHYVLHVTTAAHGRGLCDIRVKVGNAWTPLATADRFTFVAAVPTVTGLSPADGVTTGAGTSPNSSANVFTYAAPSSVHS
jgi:hypothetical protein